MAMNIPKLQRKYDLIVLGATGYTGKLCGEHIATSLPANLKWAIAGRSEAKLLALLEGLKILNVDRTQPDVEVASLSYQDVENLVKKTRVLINTIGPYYLYSSPVVAACAKNGTHYLDVTGESPWVLEMIEKHHASAKASQAIIIPEIGIESAPSDLLAFALTKLIEQKLRVGTKEVIGCIHEVKGMPSGGTLATVLGILDRYSLKEIAKSAGTWASSPVPAPKLKNSTPLLTRVFGVRSVPGLGVLTTSISAGPNVATVQRSWGLLDSGSLYGPKFSYQEYAAVRNIALGIAVHFVLVFGALVLAVPPVRCLLKQVLYAPGQGATREATTQDTIEYRAVAMADQEGPDPRRAFGRLRFDGGNYRFTGICLAEAAMVLLKEDDLVKRLGGGLLTPAMIAEPFVDRLKNVGMVFELEMMQ